MLLTSKRTTDDLPAPDLVEAILFNVQRALNTALEHDEFISCEIEMDGGEGSMPSDDRLRMRGRDSTMKITLIIEGNELKRASS